MAQLTARQASRAEFRSAYALPFGEILPQPPTEVESLSKHDGNSSAPSIDFPTPHRHNTINQLMIAVRYFMINVVPYPGSNVAILKT